MALYVLENFNWDLRGAVFPSLPFPEDYQHLCPYFHLVAAEEATRDFLRVEIPQVIFYTMVLNNAMELGMLSEGMLEILEFALVGPQ